MLDPGSEVWTPPPLFSSEESKAWRARYPVGPLSVRRQVEQVGRDANAADRVAVRLLLYAECSDARKLVPRAHSSMWLYSTGNVSLIFIKV